MKVAIIGAGPAGLASAIELQKHGIIPDIFERNSRIGSLLEHTITTMKIFDRSFLDPLKVLKRKYGFSIEPIAPLKKIHMLGPGKETEIKGNFGNILKMGIENFSVENQLAAHVHAPLFFNRLVDIDEIKNDYDYLIAATGDGSIGKALNVWETNFNLQVMIATVIGDFDTTSMKVWFNTNYSKNCYALLLPNNNREANLTLAVNNASKSDLSFFWKEFLINEKIKYTFTETRELEYNIGTVKKFHTDKVYFVGNAGGFNDDFLGFGIINAIESGILAARSIACKQDYEKQARILKKRNAKLHEFRDSMNHLNNKELNMLLTFLGFPGVKQIIYNNPLYKVHYMTFLAKLLNYAKEKMK